MVSNLNQYRFNYSFLFWFFFFTLNFLFFFILNSSAATQVSLEWDPNSEPDLSGYRIFVREQNQSYVFASPSWEGTDTYCTIYNLDETKTYCFVARAYDTSGNESENSIELCNEPSVILNQLPIADAGPDQDVNEGQDVSLDASNSTDPDGDIASYQWVQIGGPSVNLFNPDTVHPTFTAPAVDLEGAALTFELTVADNNGLESIDSCIVNITYLNDPPQADAGDDQSEYEGVDITLDGSSSVDIDGNIASFLWTQTSGPAVTLLNATQEQTTFTAPNVDLNGASLTFDLTVTDTGGLKDTDSCIVNIRGQNEPPTAVVTPEYTETTEGTLVELDGSGSTDADDGIESYRWSQIEGDPVTLSYPTPAVMKFTAPKSDQLGKNLKFKLTVKDHGGLQAEAESFVYVIQNEVSNTPPVADFKYGTRRTNVTFTDQSTDNDGTIVSWLWNFGDGKTSIEKNPRHSYSSYGTYVITLTVTDDGEAKNSQSKTVTFETKKSRGRRWR